MVLSIVDKGVSLVDSARDEGLILRLLGAVAFQIHCPKFRYLSEKMQRTLTDIDFAAYGKQRQGIVQFFKKNKVPQLHEDITALLPRMIYQDPSGLTIDVFLDRLEMCHTINFTGRLETDQWTVPLAELLLEKLQIVRINEKDIKDVIMLLREHELGQGDKEVINSGYITELLSADWGFYHTVELNLRKIDAVILNHNALTDEDRQDVHAKIDSLLQTMEGTPKSLRWKIRAKVGESQKWYTDVEEVVS